MVDAASVKRWVMPMGATPRRLVLWPVAWLCALLVACAVLPRSAAARERKHRSARDSQRAASQDADRLLREGMAALQASRFADASRLLGAAYAAAPSPQGLYQLGLLALAEKRDLDAHDLMRRFLADPDLDRESEGASASGSASGSVSGSASGSAAAELKEAERVLGLPRPPAGTLNILGERGTRVFVDGRLVGVLPLSLPLLLSPVEHKLALELGQKRVEDQVQIPAGRLGELRSDVSSRALLLSTLPGVLFVADFHNVPPELRARLQQAVEKALLSRRLSPLGSDLAIALLPAAARKLADCVQDISCQVDLAKQVEAEAVLHVKTEIEKGALRLQVALIDIVVSEPAASDELRIENFAPEQAGAGLLGLVSRVYEKGSGRPRAELVLTCDPDRAELQIDGKVVTPCSHKRAVFAGEHHIVVRLPGYQTDDQRLQLRDAEQRSLTVRLLEPEPAPAPLLPPPPHIPKRQPRPAWRLALGGVALAGGLVSAGFGAAMISIDGQCVRPPDSDGGACERQYVTRAPGGVTLGLGLGVAIAGAVLIGLPGPMK